MNIKTFLMLALLSSSMTYLPLAMTSENTAGHAHKDGEEHAEHNDDEKGHEEHAEHNDDEKGHEEHAEHNGEEKGHKEHAEHSGEEKGHEEHAEHNDDEKGHEEHAEHNDDEKGHEEEGEEAHGGHGGGGHDEHSDGTTDLNSAQMEIAGIIVRPLQIQAVNSTIKAPGEVRFNTYKTVSITPRITAQVIDRHVVLGQLVRKGQPIVTLSSVEMAEAQGNLLVADREWKRVKTLGRKVVSARRHTGAKINWELAKAKVKAYGMSTPQIEKLISSENFSRANGRFELVTSSSGTVLKENYILGQQADPGEELIRITDESSLWVIANVPPAIAHEISVGNQANVEFSGRIFPAKVAQINHSLDEITRTTGIRLLVENKDDALHPGLFVNTQIETSSQSQALTVPEAAVLRSADGDWEVFVEQGKAGKFKGQEVELVRISDGIAIIKGIKPATRVVVKGAFFVQSELAKSGFEIHNH